MAQRTVETPQELMLDGPVDRLDVHLVAGRLTVIGTDEPAHIEVTRIGNVPLVVEERDGQLSLRHQRISRGSGLLRWLSQIGRRYRTEVSIAVPPTARVDLHLISGSAIVSGLEATTDVEVTSGQIHLMELAGRTRAKLVSGLVQALSVGGELTLETISGQLLVGDSIAERVQATTVSGEIFCDLDNPRPSEIRLGTTSGGITVRVPVDSDLAVHLQTTSGLITSAFDQLSAAASWSKESRGVLGASAGKLFAMSTSGNISLLPRPVTNEPTDHEPVREESGM